MPLKNIYTFYLKHQNYPFCAPIFHPLSETESEHISENHTHQFKLNPLGNWNELGTYSFLGRHVSMIYNILIYCIYWEFKEINHYLNREVLQDAWKSLLFFIKAPQCSGPITDSTVVKLNLVSLTPHPHLRAGCISHLLPLPRKSLTTTIQQGGLMTLKNKLS